MDLVIDPAQTFQTIAGWGHGGGVLGGTEGASSMLWPAVADPVNHEYLDYLVDDLGLTGTRTWEVGPRIDGTGNDHGDCDMIDWNLFESDTLSASDAALLLYYQNRIIGEGYSSSLYSSPGYPTHASDQKPWVMNHPGERAQQIWASALYYKTNYGININFAVIYNEPSFAVGILSDDAKALGPRLASQGLATQIQYAEAVAPQTDWGYVTPVMSDPDMWQWVGRISYHNYGTADPYRAFLRDYGGARGLTTAQTEMGNPTFDDLFADLTLGGVSYWEVAYSASATLNPSSGLTSFTPSGTYFRLRQLMHYVRPGAVRIAATASDSSVRALAFSQSNGITTVIETMTNGAVTVNLYALPPGSYGVSQSPSGATSFKELGIRTVGVNGALTLTNLPGNTTVTTVYPYAGTNLPPTIEVWGTTPGYLVAPTNSATLSVTASDPELAPLTYRWSVTNEPAGAGATLVSSNAATTAVHGLIVAGTYVFNIAVSDGTNTSMKQVYLNVFGTNPPPVLGATGFRIAAPYGLVFGNPTNITHGQIELPTSTVILQAGISDLANDDFTGRGLWTLVSQPPGASAGVSSTTYIFVSLRATVTNMVVPGDYLFQINVTNPGQPDLVSQILCTVSPASATPIINSLTATPGSITLPANSLQLSAVISGGPNDVLRQWWEPKTIPAGAEPVFDHQGATNTTVSNLVIPGSYTYTLRAFNDLYMTNQDITFHVTAAPGTPVITSAAAASVIVGNPFSYAITANNGQTGFGAMNLPAGLSFSNGVISGTPAVVGAYNILLSATNASGVGYGNLTLTVKLLPPQFTSPVTFDGLVNAPFTNTVQAVNVPTSFSASGLPPGLSIINSLTGVIGGIPTSAGIFNATVIAANSTGQTTDNVTIVIYNSAPSAPLITSSLTATGTVAAGFNYQITAMNYPTSFFVIGLPAGLSFDPSQGRIFGTPWVAGNFTVTLRANNSGGTGSASLALTINPAPPPDIAGVELLNGFALSFLTQSNRHYGVDWTPSLLPVNWTSLTNGIPGNTLMQTVTDLTTNAPARFYRLKVSTP